VPVWSGSVGATARNCRAARLVMTTFIYRETSKPQALKRHRLCSICGVQLIRIKVTPVQHSLRPHAVLAHVAEGHWSGVLDAARRPRVANRAAINRQGQFINGKLLRSLYAFLALPFAPSMLAAVDLAIAENAHPLGAAVPDNFATDFDLGGHGLPSLSIG
jgi:hypothetical protein